MSDPDAPGPMLSLIVPVYNEAATLPELWALLQACPWPVPVEYLLVDDGSTDGSRELLASLKADRVQRILKERNEGKTAAIRSGIAAANGSVIAVQDADLEYDPGDLVRMLGPVLEDRADVVYGSRFKQTSEQVHRTWHRLGIRVLTAFSNLCTGIYLTDLEGCYKVWRADLLKNLVVSSERFDFDPEVTAKIARLRVRILEQSISYNPRRYVEGKKIRWRDGFRALWALVRYRFLVSDAASYRETLPARYRRT